MAVRGQRPRRRPGRGHVLAHLHRQAQRRRPARLSRRRPGPHRRPPRLPPARAAALALARGPRGRSCCQGGLTVAAPSYVFTIARAAQMLGEDEEWLEELADQLEPEDGCLWIYDTEDRATLGFTARGIESLKELSLDQKR